ncbi:DUF2793 domain-containing protein [Pseudotabrizicola algicola]|uniref:DUF2793 domain-containing protein n=1 Tax=Pseudotabrizicola algicola TaxID=2709381 RepID=A0A6B3RSG2_9RHOB|nr:DUF2793 domain-containing protein [Pseudotabrizicola algicola]NEX47748.1 DUF2793 domain-containing protein [Pseudotabrizicola algicola]
MPDFERSGRLKLPYIMPAQAQKHITHNEAVQMLDAIVQLAVQSFDSQSPPSAPENGHVYALGAAPTGVWAQAPGHLAYWNAGGWLYLLPQEGWLAHDLATGQLRQYRGGSWQLLLQNLQGLGVGTTSDAVNRLAVASAATLFSHAGAGHQMKVNKATASDTASLLFQSGWSGRAEMGLAGNDSFSIKVSADGNTFTTALSVNPANGLLAGAAVTDTASDLTPGRLLKVGAGAGQLDPSLYRRGTVLGPVSQSGGQPTGALIERGSNANGNYMRFADGTQICTRRVQLTGISINVAMGSLFRATVGSFDFPATFATVESVGVTMMASQNASIRNNASVLKTRQGSTLGEADWVGIALWAPSSITGTAGELTHLSLNAIGTWF